MGKPRITIQVSEEGGASGVVELFINEEGRELLLKELQDLSKDNDHFHLFAPEWGAPHGVLSLKSYSEDAATAGHFKVLFRPDDWDRKYYPHLMDLDGSESK